jgi:hypothetical protein
MTVSTIPIHANIIRSVTRDTTFPPEAFVGAALNVVTLPFLELHITELLPGGLLLMKAPDVALTTLSARATQSRSPVDVILIWSTLQRTGSSTLLELTGLLFHQRRKVLLTDQYCRKDICPHRHHTNLGNLN